MSPPACGPKGFAVAETLRPFVAQMLKVEEGELDNLSLEDLAQRVSDEASDRLDELREQASQAFEFRRIEPNFGHEAVALLLREGLVQAITVNWDCGIEQAGLGMAIGIQGVANLKESLELAHQLPLYKVHGCATRSKTLAITQDEVDCPQAWAVGRTQGALTGGVVVFVGLGTIGLYVQEPFAQLVSAWASEAATVAVVDPDLHDNWRKVLGADQAESMHLSRGADTFMDELLRALVRDALDTVDRLAREMAQNEEWGKSVVAGLVELRHAFDQATANGILRWWRDGVMENRSGGSPFITELPGHKCLLTVAQLTANDGGGVEVAGAPGRQTVATGAQYFEIVCRSGQHIGQVQIVARSRIDRRNDEGVYSTIKPVTVVVVDALGEFPSEAAPTDISVVDSDHADIAAGGESILIRFVAAEDGVRGKLAA